MTPIQCSFYAAALRQHVKCVCCEVSRYTLKGLVPRELLRELGELVCSAVAIGGADWS